MKTKPWLWVILAPLLVLPVTALGGTALGSAFIPPVIRLDTVPAPEPEAPSKSEPGPSISFSIPQYELSLLDRETIAACLVLEAASQGDFGMRAVMSVIRNRSRGLPELFALSVLRPKQFSALNTVTAGRMPLARAIARAKNDAMWPTALAIVDDSVDASWHDATGGATHYTRAVERTRWTRSLAKTVTIGAHSFYR
ncbi:MAG: cell wall hydrolase [Verrucomicrobiota bacterium]